MASELIEDFPLRRNHVHVRFAKSAQLYTVPRHDDKNRSELWYTEAEYNSMKRTTKQDALQVRDEIRGCLKEKSSVGGECAQLLCDEWPYFGAEVEAEEASPDPTSQPASGALHHAAYLLLLLLGPATAHAVATWMISVLRWRWLYMESLCESRNLISVCVTEASDQVTVK